LETVSIGKKVLVEVPRGFVVDYPVPANGIVIKKIVGASSILIEEVCLLNEGICYFDFPIDYVADNLINWVFALKAFKRKTPIIPYSNRMIMDFTRDNILTLVEKYIKEIRRA